MNRSRDLYEKIAFASQITNKHKCENKLGVVENKVLIDNIFQMRFEPEVKFVVSKIKLTFRFHI